MSSDVQVTSRSQYDVLRLFGMGKNERQIADLTTFDIRMVTRTVNDLCAGDQSTAKDVAAAYERRASAVAAAQGKPGAELARPAAPATPPAQPVAAAAASVDLLAAAATSPHRKTRSLGAKISALLADLEAHVRVERERAEAVAQRAAARAEVQRRVDQLQAELAKAREALRAAGSTPLATAPAAAAGVPPKTIRGWAISAGVDCPDRGRVPQPVVDAYYAAHPDAPRP